MKLSAGALNFLRESLLFLHLKKPYDHINQSAHLRDAARQTGDEELTLRVGGETANGLAHHANRGLVGERIVARDRRQKVDKAKAFAARRALLLDSGGRVDRAAQHKALAQVFVGGLRGWKDRQAEEESFDFQINGKNELKQDAFSPKAVPRQFT